MSHSHGPRLTCRIFLLPDVSSHISPKLLVFCLLRIKTLVQGRIVFFVNWGTDTHAGRRYVDDIDDGAPS